MHLLALPLLSVGPIEVQLADLAQAGAPFELGLKAGDPGLALKGPDDIEHLFCGFGVLL